MDYPVGSVIEYSVKEGGEIALGVVLEGGKSLLVLDSAGGRGRVSLKNVVGAPVTAFGAGAGEAAWLGALRGLNAEVEALASGAALDEVWELLREEGESGVTLDALVDLLFGAVEVKSRLAGLRRLRVEGMYFKERRDGRWEVRTAEQVAAAQQERERQQRGADERARVAESLTRLLRMGDAPREARRAAWEEARQDSAFASRMDLLIELAAWGDDAPRRARGLELLDELSNVLDGAKVEGRGNARAFETLVRAGRFSRWENLWMVRYGIRGGFDPAVGAAAESLAATLPFIGASSPPEAPADPVWRREDLTGLEIVTIDAPSTRDIDDGVSLVERADGGWSLGVHIADPASIVPLDHPLDQEARRRGTSVYVPGRTIPMFPPEFSEGVMSLVAGELRPAMSYLVELSAALEIVDWRIVPSWIRVRHRMSYEQVDAILGGAEAHPMEATLRGMNAVAGALKARRLARGAVIMTLAQCDVVVRGERDAEGRLWELESVEIKPSAREASRLLVGEMMILVGELTGLYAARHQLPVIYRTQAPPPDAADEARVAGRELDLVASFELRRVMQKGEVRTTPGAHFGLGLEAYVQATSPIRRYSDLVHHRQLHAHLCGAPAPYDASSIVTAAGQVDALASEAAAVQRETTRFWKLVWLEGQVGQEMAGTVVQYARDRTDRALVQLDPVALTTMISLTDACAPGDPVVLLIDQARARRDVLVVRMVRRA